MGMAVRKCNRFMLGGVLRYVDDLCSSFYSVIMRLKSCVFRVYLNLYNARVFDHGVVGF